MINQLRGKKLLILGAGATEVTLVKRAQQLGIHTIVTDYHTDYSLSPAKKVADEAWNISWADLDMLERLCREHHVDGVTAGFSEFRVDNMIKLCQRLDFPCYITQEQLEITRDKRKFKEACRQSGVPVVKEFACVEDVDAFPVIVKPVDRAGSIGVGIATNPEELEKAYAYALEMSVSKQVIIEEFIHRGTKFDVYYAIFNGEIVLLTSDDVINAQANGFERVVQSGWVLPSVHSERYRQKVDASMRSMIRNMGIKNGYIFFSGFVRDEEFVFFEAGFRLCGGHLSEYLMQKGMGNNLDIFISHALLGTTADVCFAADKNPDLKCVNVNLYAKNGTVASISGMEEVAQMEDCMFTLVQGRVGQQCTLDTAILSHMGLFYFCNESPEKLMEDVREAYKRISITDVEGNDMIYDRIDASAIATWWS